ncbi:HAD family hydrolase [Brachybacterium hainanense]|uniref:HAD family hydrolase n=1 Tax=Brachybacterium hainanense TaxID=1541174 RepID=A0ABV6RAG6_9MICO
MSDLLGTLPLSVWPSTWTPRAVVFDLDGTLVNTEAEWVAVQDRYLAEHGASISEQTRRDITGRAAEVVVLAIARAVDKDPHLVGRELVDAHREGMRGRDGFAMLPGALATVAAIAAKVPVVIASNSPRDMLDHKLEVTGLLALVDAHVAIEDVPLPKPAPDMYHHAAALLGAEPSAALAFEDSETGAEAALAAGLNLIAIPSLPGQDPQAHLRLTSLEDPQLQSWIAGWESVR